MASRTTFTRVTPPPPHSRAASPPAAGARVRAATRITALRARGLRATSASDGFTARPTSESGAPGSAVGANGQPGERGVAGVRLRRAGQELLDDAVLERVEADDGHPCVRGQRRHDGGQRLRDFRQFAVHENPKGLEGPRGRILTPITPRARADGLRHECRQLPGAVDGFARACRRNCSCNRLSRPFFTIVAQYLRQFAHRGAGKEFGSGFAARRVHPHVQRTVVAKGKAARRVVDLRRGDSEIEQHAVDLRERKLGEDVGQFRKPRAAENESGIGLRELRRGRFGGRVAIDADETPRRAKPSEDRARVAAAAERGVDVDARGLDRQRRHGFVEKDGDMDSIGHECATA